MKYVPILKWKRGERIAIRNLDNDIKDQVSPLFTAMENDEPDTFALKVSRDWGEERPFYFDFHPTFLDRNQYEFDTFFSELLSEAKNNNVFLIPVISSKRKDSFIKLVNDNRDKIDLGISIRLFISDFEELDNIIDNILTNVDLRNNQIDIIIDLGQLELPNEILSSISVVVNNKIKEIKKYEFRSITLCGSSFPESLGGLDKNSISSKPRKEFTIWKDIYRNHNDVRFGDYVSDDPKDIKIDHYVIIVPTIRYTFEDNWYIIRGEYDDNKPFDYTQFHKLCNMLIGSDIYCGENFSWSDNRIYECANTECTGHDCNHGNLETWVQNAVNHHITYVVNQL